MAVRAQFILEACRIAKITQTLAELAATGREFWTMVDAAANETYENRVKGSDITAMDDAAAGMFLGFAVSAEVVHPAQRLLRDRPCLFDGPGCSWKRSSQPTGWHCRTTHPRHLSKRGDWRLGLRHSMRLRRILPVG